MKTIIISLILLGAIILFFCLTSCSCPPAAQITNGKALNHWEHKHKFRVAWVKHQGMFYVVRFENMQASFNKIYERCLPDNIVTGKWVKEDSI